MPDSDDEALAEAILRTAAAAGSMPPTSDARPGFHLSDGYRVAARVIERRTAGGERPVGWKIGFTNRTIWDEYGVHAPIWGPMYDSTVAAAAAGETLSCRLGGLVEPRIEPEIALRLALTPEADMDEAALLGCIDGVAHGFEIVQSIYPGWRFKAADTVAAFALHGAYRHGPFTAVEAAERPRWLAMLTDFAIVLHRDGVEVDRGVAANVLGGPLSALRALAAGLADAPLGPGLRAGDIVTTGTVTRAFPVRAGERWRTTVTGLPVAGLEIAFV